MVEGAHEEHRHRGHRLAVRLGADVGGDRHLADVELAAAHHAAERGDERIDLLELELEGLRLHRAVLERAVVALRAGDGLQLEVGPWGCPDKEYGVVRAQAALAAPQKARRTSLSRISARGIEYIGLHLKWGR